MKEFLSKNLSFRTTLPLVWGGAMLVVMAAAIIPNWTLKRAYAQAGLIQPTISAGTGATLVYTSGTVNIGGHAVAISASSTALTSSEASCLGPVYSACNFLYVNPAGTVAATTTFATACGATTSTGCVNGLLAYAETSSVAVSNLSYPLQNALIPGQTIANGALTNVPNTYNCGTASSVGCVPANITGSLKEFLGIAALTSAAPSTATVTGISPFFTSSVTYICTAQDVSTIANNIGVLTAGYGSSTVVFTGPNSVNDTFRYRCAGY